MNSLQLQRLCADRYSWKFLFVTADGDSSNVLAAGYLTVETNVLQILLVIHCPCWSRIVSMAAYHSHPKLDVWNISRLAHVLDTKSYDPIDEHVGNMFQNDEIADGDLDHSVNLHLWPTLIDPIRGYRGAFAREDKRGGADAIVRLACLFFPNGHPSPSSNWASSRGATIPILQKLLKDSFGRNCAKPCYSRCYTVGKFSWLAVGLALPQLVSPVVGD